MLARAPEHARSMMDKRRSEAQACIMQTRLCKMTLRTCVVWKSPRKNGVKLEISWDPSCDDVVSGEWTAFDVHVGEIFPSVSVHYFRISIDIVHRK